MLQVKATVAALALAASALAGGVATQALVTRVDVQCDPGPAAVEEPALKDFMRAVPPPNTGNPRY